MLEKRWRIAHYFSFLICIPLLAVLTMLSIGPHLAVCMCMCAYSVCVLRYFTLYPVYTFAGTDKDYFEVWKGKCKSFFSTVYSMRSSALRTAPTVRRFFPPLLSSIFLSLAFPIAGVCALSNAFVIAENRTFSQLRNLNFWKRTKANFGLVFSLYAFFFLVKHDVLHSIRPPVGCQFVSPSPRAGGQAFNFPVPSAQYAAHSKRSLESTGEAKTAREGRRPESR